MATIQNTLSLKDKFTPALGKVIDTLRKTIAVMKNTDGVSDIMLSGLNANIQESIGQLEELKDVSGQIPEPIEKTTGAFTKLKANIIVANQALNLLKSGATQLISVFEQISDLTDVQSRLKASIGVNENIYEIQKNIAKSAMSTRSSFEDTVESAIRMKTSLEDIGIGTQEAIRLAELMNKTLVLGGTKGRAAESLMYNLQQSLAMGKLRWEDWKIVASQSIYLSNVVSKHLKVTRTELNELVKQGKISSSEFIQALLASAETIDEQFENMPDTMTDWLNHLKTFFKSAFLSSKGIHEKINKMLSSETGLAIIKRIKRGILMILDFMELILTIGFKIVSFAEKHWDKISPILVAASGALTTYAGILALTAAKTWLVTYANRAFISSLLTNPLTWVAVSLGVIVALLYEWTMSLGGLKSAWEISVKYFKYSYEYLKVLFTGIQYAFYNMIDYIKVGMLSGANVIYSVITKLKNDVLSGLESMANGSIKILNAFIEKANKLPGVNVGLMESINLTAKSKLNDTTNDKFIKAYNQSALAAIKERAKTMDTLEENLKTQKSLFNSFYEKIKSEALKATEEQEFTINGGMLDSIGKINDAISITDEDIKLLKDVAKVEFVNKYTTLQPNLQVSFGDVKETADVGQIIETIENMVKDAYGSALVGN